MTCNCSIYLNFHNYIDMIFLSVNKLFMIFISLHFFQLTQRILKYYSFSYIINITVMAFPICGVSFDVRTAVPVKQCLKFNVLEYISFGCMLSFYVFCLSYLSLCSQYKCLIHYIFQNFKHYFLCSCLIHLELIVHYTVEYQSEFIFLHFKKTFLSHLLLMTI